MLAYHGIIVSSTCERFGHIVPSLGARNSYVINSRLTNYCGQIGCKIRSMAVSFEGVAKIVSKLIARKDADVFRDPVPWEEYGLTDYLQIVKVPMDLGTVLEKLKKRQYGTLNDCATDMRRIWANAMIYNVPGSKVYTSAKTLSEAWETSYSEIALDDVDRPPTSEEMNTWVGDCHSITAEELGKVLVKLEDSCPQCLVKRIESNEVEVNVDLVTGKAFREISAILRIYLPEGAARRKPRRVVDSVLKK